MAARRATKAVKATTTAHRASQRPEIEEWLDGYGVDWKFVPNVPISQVNVQASLNNQARIEQGVLDANTVETYTEAMKRGDAFPALVGYKKSGKYILIDGNHRIAGGQGSGTTDFDMYEVSASTEPELIDLLTYEANAKHGLPNSPEDRLRHAVALAATGTSLKAAAARLNLPLSQVSSAWARYQADQRATEVGIVKSRWNELTPNARARIGNCKYDSVMEGVAELAYRAQMPYTEIDDVVTMTNKARTEKSALSALATYRDKIKHRIRKTGGGAYKREKGAWAWTPARRLQISVSHLNHIADVSDKEILNGIASLSDADRQMLAERTRDAAEKLVSLAEKLEQ
jgi:hypothetical protein